MTLKENKMLISIRDLKFGDVFCLGYPNYYNIATVKNITKNQLTYFRPYVTTTTIPAKTGMAWKDGIICSVGIDIQMIDLDCGKEYELIAKGNLGYDDYTN